MKRKHHRQQTPDHTRHVFFTISLGALLIFLTFSLSVSSESSEEKPALIQIQTQTDQVVYRGGKASFYVELLSPTLFTGTPRFEVPDPNSALVYKVQGRPVLATTSIKGHSYSSQLHEFWVFPQKSGEITIPTITATFNTTSSHNDKAQTHQLTTSPFTLTVQPVPAIDETQTILSTSDFEVKQSWKPQPSDALVGDAFTRTVTMRAENMAGMFLPETKKEAVSGISMYPQPAVIKDYNERGETTGERIEVTTYLFEKDGTYSIPDIHINWWNTNTKKVEEIILPGISVNISTGAMQRGDSSPGSSLRPADFDFKPLFLVGFITICLLILFRRYTVRIRHTIGNQKQRYLQSETAYFMALKKACNSNNATEAYNRLYWWIQKRHPADLTTVTGFTEAAKQPELSVEVNALNDRLFRKDPVGKVKNWEGKSLRHQLEKARKTSHGPSKNNQKGATAINY